MATKLATLLQQHPSNPVTDTGIESSTNKEWARNYEPIRNFSIRTVIQDGRVNAMYDGPFLPLYADDDLRMNEDGYPPNYRRWRLDTERDRSSWFHTEVSNVVLAAWMRYPAVLHALEARPLTEHSVPETADDLFSFKLSNQRLPLVTGEIKRNLINEDEWQNGNLQSPDQKRLSRELRGYACKYECPQIFCFDGRILLVLQFRAAKPTDMQSRDCPVDCWVLPRENAEGATLRYALYRLMVQGLRRCQGMLSYDVTLAGYVPTYREFYSGRPIFRVGNTNTSLDEYGYSRLIDARHGAFYWKDGGQTIWDTAPLWELPSTL